MRHRHLVPKHQIKQRAFTLVELALVLLVLGVLTRSLIEPLTGARVLMDRRATDVQLNNIKESLIAHVVANGVLPCPLSPLSGPMGSPTVNGSNAGDCESGSGGLPARELGFAGAIDEHGQLMDVWNRPYVYTVSLASNEQKGEAKLPDWTSPGEATRIGLRELSADITVCSEPNASTCPQRAIRANGVVFVVLSLGGSNTSAGAQAENLDDDLEFLLQDESIEPATLFDDQLVWSTAPDVMYWMLRSGWLP